MRYIPDRTSSWCNVMTYKGVIEWVIRNMPASKHSTYIDFENAVRERFAQDGKVFPAGAIAFLQEAFTDSFPQPTTMPIQPTLEEFLSPIPSPEIADISPSFFEEQPPPEFFTTPQPLPEILRDTPSKPISFANIGRAIISGFKRLFRF